MVGNRAPTVFESLESRTLLAVTAVNYDGQKLEVFGDDGNDFIQVTTAGGRLLVNGTDVGPSANLKDVVIKTFGGNDTVILHDTSIKNSLEISTESGTDNVIIGDLDGNVDVVVGNDLKIDTGAGTEVLRLTEVQAKKMEVKASDDNDVLFLEFLNAQTELKVEMGGGDDTVLANDLDSKKLLFDGGGGSDTLIARRVSGKIEIKDFEIRVVV